ncbi:MAG: DUF4845 domain-containing protein [Sideroxydans sp.]|nr:DUF4845 domain-containing protein [Sideroxydans sp.]NOT98380.1 DUF4845 domain-containing protein [Sideroxydans sp.]
MKDFGKQQRGVSFMGFILLVALGLFLVILGMKTVPAYIHSAQIASIMKTIAGDSVLQSSSIKDIKAAYAKRASLNDIEDVTAEDLEIDQEGGSLKLSASYKKTIPVAGNVSLLLEFNPSSK